MMSFVILFLKSFINFPARMRQSCLKVSGTMNPVYFEGKQTRLESTFGVIEKQIKILTNNSLPECLSKLYFSESG